MISNLHRTKDIPTQIKNPELVARRRGQIADAAVRLFITNGFDKTTTRQIAKAARLSIGSLYEYFATKEDVLYLVLDSIYIEIEQALSTARSKGATEKTALAELIRHYFTACHRRSDYMLLLYQETHVLPREWRKRVLKSENNVISIIEKTLSEIFGSIDPALRKSSRSKILAHDIGVMAHMWTFRRWALARECSIEEYIEIQTDIILTYIEELERRTKPSPAE